MGGGIRDKDRVRLIGVNADEGEVITSAVDTLFGIDARPTPARIVRSIHATGALRLHHGVHALRVAGSNGNTDAAKVAAQRQTLRQLAPGLAAIFRLVEAAAGGAVGISGGPGWPPGGPQDAVNGLRVARIE